MDAPDNIPDDYTWTISDRYVVMDRIGTGGMAEIFRAKMFGAAGFEKEFAIKLIRPHLLDDEEFVEMFVNEAKLSVALYHTNIVQVFDFGLYNDRYYIVMEYVEGKDLLDILARCVNNNIRIPLDIGLHIISELLKGLEFAHRATDVTTGESLNIIHRDISPSNILVSYAGGVKVGDFGVAKAKMKQSLSRTGTLKGKVGYMSPEQVIGDPIDYRSDIFAAGIILYEIISMSRLFRAENDFGTMIKVRDCDIDAALKRTHPLPLELERIVRTALAKNVNDRYQTAGAFFQDLSRFCYSNGLIIDHSRVSNLMRRLFSADIERQKKKRTEENLNLRALKRTPTPGTQQLQRGEKGGSGASAQHLRQREVLLEVEVPSIESSQVDHRQGRYPESHGRVEELAKSGDVGSAGRRSVGGRVGGGEEIEDLVQGVVQEVVPASATHEEQLANKNKGLESVTDPDSRPASVAEEVSLVEEAPEVSAAQLLAQFQEDPSDDATDADNLDAVSDAFVSNSRFCASSVNDFESESTTQPPVFLSDSELLEEEEVLEDVAHLLTQEGVFPPSDASDVGFSTSSSLSRERRAAQDASQAFQPLDAATNFEHETIPETLDNFPQKRVEDLPPAFEEYPSGLRLEQVSEDLSDVEEEDLPTHAQYAGSTHAERGVGIEPTDSEDLGHRHLRQNLVTRLGNPSPAAVPSKDDGAVPFEIIDESRDLDPGDRISSPFFDSSDQYADIVSHYVEAHRSSAAAQGTLVSTAEFDRSGYATADPHPASYDRNALEIDSEIGYDEVSDPYHHHQPINSPTDTVADMGGFSLGGYIPHNLAPTAAEPNRAETLSSDVETYETSRSLDTAVGSQPFLDPPSLDPPSDPHAARSNRHALRDALKPYSQTTFYYRDDEGGTVGPLEGNQLVYFVGTTRRGEISFDTVSWQSISEFADSLLTPVEDPQPLGGGDTLIDGVEGDVVEGGEESVDIESLRKTQEDPAVTLDPEPVDTSTTSPQPAIVEEDPAASGAYNSPQPVVPEPPSPPSVPPPPPVSQNNPHAPTLGVPNPTHARKQRKSIPPPLPPAARATKAPKPKSVPQDAFLKIMAAASELEELSSTATSADLMSDARFASQVRPGEIGDPPSKLPPLATINPALEKRHNTAHRGTFHDVTFTRLLYRLITSGKTGRLVLTSGTIVKEVYFEKGRAVSVMSNLEHERLGNFLMQREHISQEQLDEALERCKRWGGRVGDALVANNVIPAYEIVNYLRMQFEEKLLEIFSWKEGSFQFYENQVTNNRNHALNVDLLRIIANGCLGRLGYHEIRECYKNRQDEPIYLTDGFKDCVDRFKLGPKAARILNSYKDGDSLAVIQSRLTPDKLELNDRVFYLTHQVEFLRFEDSKRVESPGFYFDSVADEP